MYCKYLHHSLGHWTPLIFALTKSGMIADLAVHCLYLMWQGLKIIIIDNPKKLVAPPTAHGSMDPLWLPEFGALVSVRGALQPAGALCSSSRDPKFPWLLRICDWANRHLKHSRMVKQQLNRLKNAWTTCVVPSTCVWEHIDTKVGIVVFSLSW